MAERQRGGLERLGLAFAGAGPVVIVGTLISARSWEGPIGRGLEARFGDPWTVAGLGALLTLVGALLYAGGGVITPIRRHIAGVKAGATALRRVRWALFDHCRVVRRTGKALLAAGVLAPVFALFRALGDGALFDEPRMTMPHFHLACALCALTGGLLLAIAAVVEAGTIALAHLADLPTDDPEFPHG